MAAAALLRSMARKLARAPPVPPRPLLATKIASAPPQPHHPSILTRRLHSGSTPPPTTDKIIEDLRRRLWYSRASVGIAGFMLSGTAIYGYFCLLPEVKKEREEHPSASLAQIIARTGYRKQQCNGAAEKGIMVDTLPLPLDLLKLCLDIHKETQTNLEKTRATMDQITKLAPSKQKEGCSRVG